MKAARNGQDRIPRAHPGAARLSAESQGAWVAFSAPDDIVLILSLHPLK